MADAPNVQDYVNPDQVTAGMVAKGAAKARLSVKDMLIRGFMSGMLLGFATSVALTAVADGSPPWVGALLFPLGFVILMLLGFELVTSYFVLIPTAQFDGQATVSQMARAWGWVFLANLIGSLTYAVLLYWAVTKFGHVDAGALGQVIVEKAESKTLAYKEVGATAGVATAFVKAILCNWMVATGAIMLLVSTSVIGKIVGIWLPIFAFFAMGFEHSVVNMFLIPAGILFGDTITIADWWQWNQITVTLGNIVGAILFGAMVMYYTHSVREK
ncbi:MAG: formate/nitrite transporter family protein [Solirubrobacterales bacterium]|nr:formate/nitrite transporter family protein [Solirubrobacterales bacterium]